MCCRARRNASETDSESEGTDTCKTPSDMANKTDQMATDRDGLGSPGAMETPMHEDRRTLSELMSPARQRPCKHGGQCPFGDKCKFWHEGTKSIEICAGDIRVTVRVEDGDDFEKVCSRCISVPVVVHRCIEALFADQHGCVPAGSRQGAR